MVRGGSIIHNKLVEKYETELKQLTSELKKMPTKKIYYCRNGGYIQWYEVDEGVKKYISAKNKEKIKTLVYRKYVEKRIAYLKSQIRQLKPLDVVQSKVTNEYENLISDSNYMKYVREVVEPEAISYENWASVDYQRNLKHPETLTQPTVNNLVVRSKAESMIAMTLSLHGIPFRYECLHHLSGIDIYPDFTLIDSKTGRIFIWEHFGKMDDQIYVSGLKNKLEIYAENGFLMGDNLICSFENKNHPLSIVDIEKLIYLYLE